MTLIRLRPKAVSVSGAIKARRGKTPPMTMRAFGQALWVAGVMALSSVVQIASNLHG